MARMAALQGGMVARKAIRKPPAPPDRVPDRKANTRVILTCVGQKLEDQREADRLRAGCIATTDPHDRAHDVRDGRGLLRPAAGEESASTSQSKPRRYHLSQLVGYREVVYRTPVPGTDPKLLLVEERVEGGIGVDSMFDAWWQEYLELTAIGVPLGGLTYSHQQGDSLNAAAGARDDVRLRDLLHKRTRLKGTRAELAADRAADAAANKFLEGAGETP